MKLFNRLTGRSAQRESYITNSLAPSRLVSERLLQFSGSPSRGDPTSLRFSKEWIDPDCPAAKWYQLQQGSSTRFRSIEHRRSPVSPFFHEFLLFKLADGVVCRLERFGEGSRTNAVRYVGCTSHDVIKWYDKTSATTAANIFPAGTPGDPTHVSELLAEIDFGREFDILDVLAVCCSIQRVKRCSVYTLQRFNCYFLCLTVLAVLARRAASWETVVTNEVWTTGVTSAVESFCQQSDDELQQHLFVQICSAFEPDSLRPWQPMIDLLPKYLAPESRLPVECATAIGRVLWKSAMNSAVDRALQNTLEANVEELLLEAGNDRASKLHEAIAMDADDAAEQIAHDPPLADLYAKSYLDALFQGHAAQTSEIKAWMKLQKIERRPSLSTRMQRCLISAAPVLAPVALLTPASLVRRLAVDQAEFQMMMSRPSYRLQMLRISRMAMLEDLFEDEVDEATYSALEARFDGQLNRTADTVFCQSTLSAAVRSTFTSEQLKLLFSSYLDNESCARLLSYCLSTSLAQHLHLSLESQPAHIQVKRPVQIDASAKTEQMTCGEFYDAYILPRIAEHAKRVDAVQLAAGKLVQDDIQITMEDVWQAMPKGFGATTNEALEAGP